MSKRLFFIFFLILTYTLKAQENSVTVKYISHPITIDASLDEKGWTEAKPATNFWQYFPTDTLQAKNQTEIRFLADNDNLYVGIKVFSSGNDYIVPSLRRDFRARGSDNITLMFDTFNDGANAFMFGTNPAGVLREALVSGGGKELRGFTTSWDAKWVGETKIYDGYYISEWAIPFSAFKFKEGDTKWRFNSYMFDTQANEQSTWTNIPQNQFIFNLSYMGDMLFEKPLSNAKSPISIVPFVNSYYSKDFVTTDDEFDINIGGDAKFTIGNSLNLDLTFNPDFSQVEVDQQVTNLTRFEVNLPERRQFFVENSDLFADFGSSRDANPFFSRRIGIAKDTTDTNIQNDIIAGVRLSGKLTNDFRIGLLNMQTKKDDANKIGANNNTVLALQHRIWGRSNLSFLFVNRQTTSDVDYVDPDEEYNRVVGLDYNLSTPDNTWSGKFFAHKSFTPSHGSRDYSGGAEIQYNKGKWRIGGRGLYIGEDFNSDLGFIPRTDIFKVIPQVEYLLFPKKGSINQHNISIFPVVIWRPGLDFQLSDYNIIGQWNAELKNTSNFEVSIFNRYTYLYEEFDPSGADKTPLPMDTDYKYSSFEIEYRSDSRKKFFYNLETTYGEFYNGTIFTQNIDLNLRLQPNYFMSFNLRYDSVKLPKPYSSNSIVLIGSRFDITFSKSVFWATFIQYGSQDENFGINSRLQWRFAPLSDLFLVYNDNYFTENSLAPRFRSINLKLTYWLYI